MTISINQLKNGLTILLNGEVYTVVDYEHVKPGKGAAFVRTKLKNLRTSLMLEKTFKADDKLEEAFVEEKTLQFLYSQADMYYFMDMQSYEEISLNKDILGETIKFLKDNLVVTGYFYKGSLLNINVPNFVELKVIETEPGVKGDTAKGGSKPAKLETGLVVDVPLFVSVGDTLKIDTRNLSYVERIK